MHECNHVITMDSSQPGQSRQLIAMSDVGVKMMKKNIIQILQKAPKKRTDAEILPIVDFFVFYNVFKDVKEFDDLLKLARFAEYRICHSNQILFRQGDKPDGFYVIIKGEMKGGFLQLDSLVGKYFEEINVLVDIKSGAGFGDLAIIENKQRTITMKAKKETHLLFIEKSIYVNVACPMIMKLIKMNIELLKPLLSFQMFNNEQLQEFCSISFEKKYSFGAVLNNQDKPPEKIYIIKSGIIEGFRMIHLSNLKHETKQRHAAVISKIKFPVKMKLANLGQLIRQLSDHESIGNPDQQ
jgi:cGMP-dependent protein kinase